MIKEVIKAQYRMYCDFCGFSVSNTTSLPLHWSRIKISIQGSECSLDCCEPCTLLGAKIPELKDLKTRMGIK